MKLTDVEKETLKRDRFVMSMLLDLFESVYLGEVSESALIDWQYDLYCEWLIEREKIGKGVLSLKPRLVSSSVRVSVKNK